MHKHLTPHTAAYRTARHISLPLLLCKLRQVVSRCETLMSLIKVISNICNGIHTSESVQNLDHGSSEEIQEHDIHDISEADIFWERSVGLNIIRLFECRNSGVRYVVSVCPEIIGRGIPRSDDYLTTSDASIEGGGIPCRDMAECWILARVCGNKTRHDAEI